MSPEKPTTIMCENGALAIQKKRKRLSYGDGKGNWKIRSVGLRAWLITELGITPTGSKKRRSGGPTG